MRLLGVERVEDLGLQHVSVISMLHVCLVFFLLAPILMQFNRSTPVSWNSKYTMDHLDWKKYDKPLEQNCKKGQTIWK